MVENIHNNENLIKLKVNPKYTEVEVLAGMLVLHDIPFEMEQKGDGWIVFYPNKESCVCDVIQFLGSYGCEDNKLEIMGLLTEQEQEYSTTKGFLTALEVYERIKSHYEKHKGAINNVC